MRFCPFCAQETPDNERECIHCGKRMPTIFRPAAKPPAGDAPPPRPLGSEPGATPLAPGRQQPLAPISHRPTNTLLGVVAPSILPPGPGTFDDSSTEIQSAAHLADVHQAAHSSEIFEEAPTDAQPIVEGEELVALPPSETARFALRLSHLPPMPSTPEETPLSSVKYLWPLGRAIVARRRAEKSVRSQLHEAQGHLDRAFGDLGRAAYEGHIEVPAIVEERRRLESQEALRSAALRDVARLDVSLEKERARWSGEQEDRQREIERLASELRAAEEDLKARRREMASLVRKKTGFESKIRSLEKRIERAEARAQRADSEPPGKGAGPEAAEAARTDAAAARLEKDGLVPVHNEVTEQVALLEQPISELAERAKVKREALASVRRGLVEAMANHRHIEGGFEDEREKARAIQAASTRELQQRFVALGTLLSLHRVEHPRLAPRYRHIDEVRASIGDAEAAIVRLDGERRSFDRAAFQRGLITLGIVAAVLSLLVITWAVVVFR